MTIPISSIKVVPGIKAASEATAELIQKVDAEMAAAVLGELRHAQGCDCGTGRHMRTREGRLTEGSERCCVRCNRVDVDKRFRFEIGSSGALVCYDCEPRNFVERLAQRLGVTFDGGAAGFDGAAQGILDRLEAFEHAAEPAARREQLARAMFRRDMRPKAMRVCEAFPIDITIGCGDCGILEPCEKHVPGLREREQRVEQLLTKWWDENTFAERRAELEFDARAIDEEMGP